jgi:hypothetical protein
MRVLFMSLLLAFLVAVSVTAQFRSTEFGMSAAEVKEAEGAPRYETEDSLAYTDTVFEQPVIVAYLFHDGVGLWQGAYFFDRQLTVGETIGLYEAVDERLSNRYGEPMTQDIITDDARYGADRADMHQYGLKIGAVEYLTTWYAPEENLLILHELRGEDGELVHMIKYSDLAFWNEMQERYEEEGLLMGPPSPSVSLLGSL